jgi:hypothetical protein
VGRTEPSDAGPTNDRNRVRRETGKEQMVLVHYDEGAAIHIGAESCACGRDQFEPREAPSYLVEHHPAPSRSWIAAEWTITRALFGS